MVRKYSTLPDAATQAQIAAAGDTIQVTPPSASAAPSPYLPNPTSSSAFGGTWNMNPGQFATQPTANALAQQTGGQVTDTAPSNGPISYSDPQYGITGGGHTLNAGLLNSGLQNPSNTSDIAAGMGQFQSAAGIPPVVADTMARGYMPGVSMTAGGQQVNPGYAPDPMNPALSMPQQPQAGMQPPGAPITPNPGGGVGMQSYGAYGGAPGSADMSKLSQRDMGTPNYVPAGGNPGTSAPVSGGGTNMGPPAPVGSSYPPFPPSGGGLPSYSATAPTGYPNINGIPGITGPSDQNLAPELESNKQFQIAQGQNLYNQFGGFGAANANRSSALQSQMAAAYAPLGAGQGGYTGQQSADIMQATGPYGLNNLMTPDAQFASNYLTPEEQANSLGNPYQQVDAFHTGAGNVNQALTQGAADVNATIDPSALEYTPEMQQAGLNKAARTSNAQTQAEVANIQNRAFASGNTSPAALAAMEDRARQTGAINASDAMANAQVQQNQAKLAAAQTSTNIRAQNAQETAGRNTAAQQNIMGAGINTAANAEQEQAAREAYLGQNRQNINQYNQGAKFAEGSNVNQLASGRSTTVANANLQAGQEYRNNYLGGQQQQANQDVTTAGQQQLGAYSTQAGSSNQAGQNQIGNKAINNQNSPLNLLLGAKGLAVQGPQPAIIGEKFKPEAIVPIGPPRTPPSHLMPTPRYSAPRMNNTGYRRAMPRFDEGGLITGPPQGGDDPLTLDKTAWWKTGLAMAAAYGLHKFPALGGLAAGKITGEQDPSMRDVAGAVAKDTIARKNPALGNIISPPAAPGNEAQKRFFEGTVLPEVMKNPPMPQIDPMLLSRGGGNAPKIPPFPPATGTSPKQQPQPKPQVNMPRDNGMHQEAPPRAPKEDVKTKIEYPPFPPAKDIGGPPSGPSNVNAPPGPYYNPTPVPPPHVGVNPGTVDTRISFPPSAGGSGSPIDLPRGTVGSDDISRDDPAKWIDRTGNQSTDPLEGGSIDPNYPVDPYNPNGTGNDFHVNGPPTGSGAGNTNSGSGYEPDPYAPDPYEPDFGVGSIGSDYSGGPANGYNLGSDLGSAGSNGNMGGDYFGGGAGYEPIYDPMDPMGGFAKGGVFAPPVSPFGPTEVVNHPQVRMLGVNQPQAVVPLTKNPKNRITTAMLPGLMAKYAKRGARPTA